MFVAGTTALVAGLDLELLPLAFKINLIKQMNPKN